MWVLLNDAMFSIVDKAADPSDLVVRARREGDIQKHFPSAKVKKTIGSDYLFRAEIARDVVSEVIAQNIMNIDYDNFKDSVDDHELHHAYSGIWSILARLQPIAPYARRGR